MEVSRVDVLRLHSLLCEQMELLWRLRSQCAFGSNFCELVEESMTITEQQVAWMIALWEDCTILDD